jgi:hypothetical protein
VNLGGAAFGAAMRIHPENKLGIVAMANISSNHFHYETRVAALTRGRGSYWALVTRFAPVRPAIGSSDIAGDSLAGALRAPVVKRMLAHTGGRTRGRPSWQSV